MQSKSTQNLRAFSLVEVNLAILLVAVGLLSLFSLFPLGLRESEMAIVDTHEAQFADHILSALEGKALSITNWAVWNTDVDFVNAVRDDVKPLSTSGLSKKNVNGGVKFPDTAGYPNAAVRYIRYEVEFARKSARVRTAVLRVKSGNYGDFSDNQTIYATEFVYMGM